MLMSMCVNRIHPMLRMTALVCVGMVVAAGDVYVVTAVSMNIAVHMTSAVPTEASLALLACP